MSTPIIRSRQWPVICTASLFFLSGSLGCGLSDSMGMDGAQRGMISRVLGATVSATSAYFEQVADSYFHGGRTHKKEQAFNDHHFQLLRREIAPDEHRHLAGDDLSEVMPWLRFATWLNPDDIDCYLDTAFMFGLARKPKQEMAVLLEAQQANPRHYLIYLGKSRFYVKADRPEKANRELNIALALWPGTANPTNEVTVEHKREILSTRAVIREMDGDIPGAIDDMKEIVAICPPETVIHLQRRIRILEAGGRPLDSAEEKWQNLRRLHYEVVCPQGDAEHEHSEDEERHESH